MSDKTLEKVNRVEVIDHTKGVEEGGGRVYVKWEDGIRVTQDFQDHGRTLKIFIERVTDIDLTSILESTKNATIR